MEEAGFSRQTIRKKKEFSYFQTKGGLDIYEVGKRHLELGKEKAIQ